MVGKEYDIECLSNNNYCICRNKDFSNYDYKCEY